MPQLAAKTRPQHDLVAIAFSSCYNEVARGRHMRRDILTVREVSGRLRCSADTVERLYHGQQLRGFRVGRTIRVYAESVYAFMDRGQAQAAPAKAAKPKKVRRVYDYS